MTNKGKVGILLSGRGSNFEAIYEASLQPVANFEISAVISNQKNARGLEAARKYNLKSYDISPPQFNSRDDYEKQIVRVLHEHQVELVCLAGYMRIVGAPLLRAYKNRMMNIHPALLPSFPGLDAQQQAISCGVKVSGCTVHFVDEGMDTGPIIIQETVPVEDTDNEEILSQRILKLEHQIYSQAITLFFDNRLEINNRRVKVLKP